MLVIAQLPEPNWHEGRTVFATLGNFDGLHRGHQAIMLQLIARARAAPDQTAAAGATLGPAPSGLATVITFDPHPQRVLTPDRAPHRLLTADQKTRFLAALGIDATLIIPFDRNLAALEAETFVREILVRRIGIHDLLIGPDFRFGARRTGDLQLLQQLGHDLQFQAHVADAVLEGTQRISASRIRTALATGDVAQAQLLLGRPFALIGTIVHGEGRGKRQLVPTANLAPENEFLPASGVYITRFRVADTTILGLTNIGVRPTFGDRRLTVETFLPGFDGDLYGRRVELEFLQRLREERKFETPELLMEQIRRDLAEFERYREV